MKRHGKVLSVCAILSIILFMAGTHVYLLDGIDGWLFRMLQEEDNTCFAVGYTDEAFRSLRTGMSSEVVVSLVGQPLGIYDLPNGSGVIWQYSQKIKHRSFRARNVIFREDKVAEIVSNYYID